MLSLATQTDRTLFFDFLPIELGTIRGMKTRIQLYTVPGQVFYDATRKLVLRGADAVVFVADSQAPALETNKESFQNLIDNLKDQGADLEKTPHVIQWNKRDTPNALPIAVLEREVNKFHVPTFEACAMKGEGVRETLTGVAKLVLKHLAEKYGGGVVEQSVTLPGGKEQLVATAPKPTAASRTPIFPPAPPPVHTKPMEVEELSSADTLDELDEIEDGATTMGGSPVVRHLPHVSSVEVPIVLDRSLFTGDAPIEIKLKLYIK
jgi:signal recognition particle receptor subunit beta